MVQNSLNVCEFYKQGSNSLEKNSGKKVPIIPAFLTYGEKGDLSEKAILPT